jgi:hypothetical protein
MTLLWLIVWMLHGQPWLLSAWNGWNISLAIVLGLDTVNGLALKLGRRREW